MHHGVRSLLEPAGAERQQIEVAAACGVAKPVLRIPAEMPRADGSGEPPAQPVGQGRIRQPDVAERHRWCHHLVEDAELVVQ